jgi:hypothetical protein
LALPGIGAIVSLVRRVDRLFENVDKTQRGVEALEKRVSAIEDRMTALEANQGNLIVEARAASAVAASGAVIGQSLPRPPRSSSSIFGFGACACARRRPASSMAWWLGWPKGLMPFILPGTRPSARIARQAQL